MKFVPFLLLLVLILSIWFLPAITPVLAIAILVFSLGLAIFAILKKHRTAYHQGQITRSIFLRNTFLDVLGVLLAMALAVLLARYIARIAAAPVNNDLTMQTVGILIALLVGTGVGILVNRLWERFVKTSPQR